MTAKGMTGDEGEGSIPGSAPDRSRVRLSCAMSDGVTPVERYERCSEGCNWRLVECGIARDGREVERCVRCEKEGGSYVGVPLSWMKECRRKMVSCRGRDTPLEEGRRGANGNGSRVCVCWRLSMPFCLLLLSFLSLREREKGEVGR